MRQKLVNPTPVSWSKRPFGFILFFFASILSDSFNFEILKFCLSIFFLVRMDSYAAQYFPPNHHASTIATKKIKIARKKLKRGVDCKLDLISDLPQGVIEEILTKLPIRDAVKTSLLSTKWRYRWVSMPHLVFNDIMTRQYNDKTHVQKGIINFITRVLLLHEGPIHKFFLSSSFLQSSSDIDLWLHVASLKDVKILVIRLAKDEWFKAPCSVFNFKKLTRLDLVRCHLKLPPNFKGFMCLENLHLEHVSIEQDHLERLISSCPLLRSMILSYFGSFNLTIRAPNLKYLFLDGDVFDFCLENTPLLFSIYVRMFKIVESLEEQSSSNNFDRLFGGVPKLERLMGDVYFTKYLSLGYDPERSFVTCPYLKSIDLTGVSFDDTKQVLVVFQLIVNSPNLEELSISVSSIAKASRNASYLKILDDVISSDAALQRLRTVKLINMSGRPHEIKFLKYLLERSPILEEMMFYDSSLHFMERRSNMSMKLVGFRRASPRASIIFVDEAE